MKLGYIGLGKMGKNMVLRLREKGHDIVAYNRSADDYAEVEQAGAVCAPSIEAMVAQLPTPRTVWLMVPNAAVDDVMSHVVGLLATGDTVIDGGNSHYTDSLRRYADLKSKGIRYIDAGVSGGPAGARHGACVMVGGEVEIVSAYEPLFKDIAVEGGYLHAGAAGAGHFVKMVHNGIEYGMMQALAEGFAVLRQSPFSLDLQKVAELYNHQSVISSRLVGWLSDVYKAYGPSLEAVSGTVAHTGEGQWTVEAAHELGVPVPIIEGALAFRKLSAEQPSYTGQILSALRNQFGGHDITGR